MKKIIVRLTEELLDWFAIAALLTTNSYVYTWVKSYIVPVIYLLTSTLHFLCKIILAASGLCWGTQDFHFIMQDLSLRCMDSLAVAQGLSGCSSGAPEWGSKLQQLLLVGMLAPGIKPMSPALQGRFLTTVDRGSLITFPFDDNSLGFNTSKNIMVANVFECYCSRCFIH